MNIPIPDPDEVDIFIHNHAVLTKISWALMVITGYELLRGAWLPAALLVLAVVVTRSMARLLCGWVHTWAAFHVEKYKELG